MHYVCARPNDQRRCAVCVSSELGSWADGRAGSRRVSERASGRPSAAYIRFSVAGYFYYYNFFYFYYLSLSFRGRKRGKRNKYPSACRDDALNYVTPLQLYPTTSRFTTAMIIKKNSVSGSLISPSLSRRSAYMSSGRRRCCCYYYYYYYHG